MRISSTGNVRLYRVVPVFEDIPSGNHYSGIACGPYDTIEAAKGARTRLFKGAHEPNHRVVSALIEASWVDWHPVVLSGDGGEAGR